METKRKGVGRPKLEKKRDRQLTLRISEDELELLGRLAKKHNLTRANTIIKALKELDK